MLDAPLSVEISTGPPLQNLCRWTTYLGLHAKRPLTRVRAVAWNTVFDSGGLLAPPGDLFLLHFPPFPFPHVISFLFNPFPVEKYQRGDLWNPLHSLVISGNIGANISLLIKYLGLNKVEMSVKILLIITDGF